MRRNTWKNADYPNAIPKYAGKVPLYSAYNKLQGFTGESHLNSTARGLKKMGYKVIIKSDDITGDPIIYFRKK